MKRKIIKQGLGGYTIYLPKEWVDRKGLKEGKELEIIEVENDLIIKSSVVKEKNATIKITEDNEKHLKIMLTHLYRKGFNSIEIQNTSENNLTEIKNVVQNLLLGFEITSQTKDKCTIENISEPTAEKFDALLRRIFLIIKETQNTIITELEKNNKYLNLNAIEDYSNQLDKYVLFCRRVVIKERYEQNPITMWELLTFLTHIQHAHFYMYKYAYENKIKATKETINLLKSLKDYFEIYYDAYFKKDITYVHKLNQLKNKFQFGECIKLLEKVKDAVMYSYIREIFRMIQIGSSPILSELIELEI